MKRRVRVRFAPSPTGALHIGGVRTALYNYFFAKQHSGDFIIRIEDTDSKRFVPGAEEYIINSLKWCGITIDEGIGSDNYDSKKLSYKQSERKHIYLEYVTKLIESGNAYYAFDSVESLDEERKKYEALGENFAYNSQVRDNLDNSLSLTADELSERLSSTNTWVVRFKTPKNRDIVCEDIIRGQIVVNSNTLDDKVLYKKTDELPTYHLANITDDYLMDISHVIRGEEWLPSLPLHILLYEALGIKDKMPEFAHLPLLLKPSGNGKLSKRDGDKLGFPVFPLNWETPEGEIYSGYREAGYFPKAVVNILSLLGWHPSGDNEIMEMSEFIEAFDLSKVSKSGARFDLDKAKWINAYYLKKESTESLVNILKEEILKSGIDSLLTDATLFSLVEVYRDRVSFVKEILVVGSFWFKAPTIYDSKIVSKQYSHESEFILLSCLEVIERGISLSQEELEALIKSFITENGYKMGNVMSLLRVSLVGKSEGPDLAYIIKTLGIDEVIKRIKYFVNEQEK